MLKWLAKKQIDAFGRRWNYDTSYMTEIIDKAGLKAMMPMQSLQKLTSYRGGLPLDVYCAAGLTASRHADCGPCLQLGVKMAEAEGVSPGVIRAILENDLGALSEEALLGVELALSTIRRDTTGDEARAEIVRRWGHQGLAALAYAIVAAQAFPTFKYAIGHGHACVRVQVGDQTISLREPKYA